MIHVKDYQTLDTLVKTDFSPFRLQLQPLVGKQITVFVDSGDAGHNHFTGILIEVSSDHIRLITSPPPKARNRTCHSCSSMGRSCATTNVHIMINHIDAIAYDYV